MSTSKAIAPSEGIANMYTALYFITLLFAIFLNVQSVTSAPAPPVLPLSTSNINTTTSWPEWSGVKKLFVFGASYTSTGFDWHREQPSLPGNPLGNSLRRTAAQGPTVSNGPNFITYLTTTFNASKLLTYNFANPGAEIDGSAANPDMAGTSNNDLVYEVNSFLSTYTYAKGGVPMAEWRGDSSLFLFFFGVNDNIHTWHKPNRAAITNRIFQTYEQELNLLYDQGARNFLLLNTPPMELMPRYTGNGTNEGAPHTQEKRDGIKAQVDDYNSHYPRLISNFKASHPEAEIKVFDLHSLFAEMQSSLETTNALTSRYASHRIENLNSVCTAYVTPYDGKLPSEDYFDARCGASFGAYFWFNHIHPTWSVHKVMAGKISELLWNW
ncbi:MAG: hypothetical protein Q9213_001381 [Squamulea squamosa]